MSGQLRAFRRAHNRRITAAREREDRKTRAQQDAARAALARRIVYGARCTWWDSADKAGRKESGLPCCPFCGSVLMEVDDEAEWWRGIERNPQSETVPHFHDFVTWLRGQCFSSFEAARSVFELERHAQGGAA